MTPYKRRKIALNLALVAGDAWAMKSAENFWQEARRACQRSLPGVTDEEIWQVLRMTLFEALEIPRKEPNT